MKSTIIIEIKALLHAIEATTIPERIDQHFKEIATLVRKARREQKGEQ